jgi:hypothetical protein
MLSHGAYTPYTVANKVQYSENQIKLIGLNEHTQQIGSSQLVDKAGHMLFARTVCALQGYSDRAYCACSAYV